MRSDWICRVTWVDQNGRLANSYIYFMNNYLALENGVVLPSPEWLRDRDAAAAVEWRTSITRDWYYQNISRIARGNPTPPAQLPVAYGAQQTTLPSGVSNFSWGALFFPFWWPLVYGLGGYAMLGLLLTVLSPLSLPFLVWFGFAVPKAYWRRYPYNMSTEEFNRRQTKWIVWGVVLLTLVLVYYFIVFIAAASSTSY